MGLAEQVQRMEDVGGAGNGKALHIRRSRICHEAEGGAIDERFKLRHPQPDFGSFLGQRGQPLIAGARSQSLRFIEEFDPWISRDESRPRIAFSFCSFLRYLQVNSDCGNEVCASELQGHIPLGKMFTMNFLRALILGRRAAFLLHRPGETS
jgi:hypothetical protein